MPIATPKRTGGLGWDGLATVTPKTAIFEVAIDDILIPATMRPLDDETVDRIVESIQEIGLQAAGFPTIEWAPAGSAQRAVLVVGGHRLEALRRLGWEMVPVSVFEGDAAEAELWRIAENLARKELSVLERANHIQHWIQLRTEKRAQDAQVSAGGRGNRGGISDAARELGVDRRTVQRAVRVAGLADEAKTEASRLKLDDNQMALTHAAGGGGTAEQIERLQRYAARHARAIRRQQAITPVSDLAAAASAQWQIEHFARIDEEQDAAAAAGEPVIADLEEIAVAQSDVMAALTRLLHVDPDLDKILGELLRALDDERPKIAGMPLIKRVVLARGFLHALTLTLADLQPVR